MILTSALWKIITQLIYIVLLLSIIFMEYEILQPNRGSAMGIPISIYYIPSILLLIPILFLIDKKLSVPFSRIFGMVTHIIFLLYFIYKSTYYYRVHHDVQFYKEHFDGYYSPSLFDLGFIFMISFLIVFWSIIKIKKSFK